MLWKDLTVAAHGLKATVQYLLPMEQGMSMARQMSAPVLVAQASGVISCSTYSDTPKLLVNDGGLVSYRIFSPTAIVILKES